ncbi:MAG TPA: hypothetical protein VKU84_00295 [Stellaceae bacterium]|nr:hypothetical protein [Stellaceae bacterium]
MAVAHIPLLDVTPLFGAAAPAREAVDEAIMSAACETGFLSIQGLPPAVPLGRAARARLFRIFSLGEAALRALWRQKFEPGNANVYRGWFPVQPAT